MEQKWWFWVIFGYGYIMGWVCVIGNQIAPADTIVHRDIIVGQNPCNRPEVGIVNWEFVGAIAPDIAVCRRHPTNVSTWPKLLHRWAP